MASYRDSHLGDHRGAVYDRRYAVGAERFYWEHFERPCLEALFERLSRSFPGSYLDFATGTGRILQVACRYFPRVVGIDIS